MDGDEDVIALAHYALSLGDVTDVPGTDSDCAWLVPRHATEEMMRAGLYHCSHDMTWADLHTAFTAMVDASEKLRAVPPAVTRD